MLYSMKIPATYSVKWLSFICIYVLKVQVYISPAHISECSTYQLFHMFGTTVEAVLSMTSSVKTHQFLQHIYFASLHI
jgi:hypothetical protein